MAHHMSELCVVTEKPPAIERTIPRQVERVGDDHYGDSVDGVSQPRAASPRQFIVTLSDDGAVARVEKNHSNDVGSACSECDVDQISVLCAKLDTFVVGRQEPHERANRFPTYCERWRGSGALCLRCLRCSRCSRCLHCLRCLRWMCCNRRIRKVSVAPLRCCELAPFTHNNADRPPVFNGFPGHHLLWSFVGAFCGIFLLCAFHFGVWLRFTTSITGIVGSFGAQAVLLYAIPMAGAVRKTSSEVVVVVVGGTVATAGDVQIQTG